MLKQLLWIEVALKGGCGLILFLMPVRAAAIAGFAAAGSGFWPRVLGAVLIGLAGALLLQGSFPAVRTLSPAGLVIINLAGAGGLVTAQVMGTAAQTRRGSVLLALLVLALTVISLFEIYFA